MCGCTPASSVGPTKLPISYPGTATPRPSSRHWAPCQQHKRTPGECTQPSAQQLIGMLLFLSLCFQDTHSEWGELSDGCLCTSAKATDAMQRHTHSCRSYMHQACNGHGEQKRVVVTTRQVVKGRWRLCYGMKDNNRIIRESNMVPETQPHETEP